MEIDAKSFGERIKAVRGDRNQNDFAEFLGTSRNSLSRYETGERLPDADFLTKLIELHPDIDAVWFVTGKSLDVGELSPAEKILMSNFRGLSEPEKDVMRRAIALLANERSKAAKKGKTP